MFDYLAICVETANENASSICQLGFASVKNGKIVGHFSKNIITKEEFDPFFSHIHGIGRHNLNGAVAFSDIHKEIHDMLEGQIVVTPSVFDRIVFTKAMKNNNLIIPNIKWLDLTSMTKNTWPEWNNEGYTLGSINEQLLLEKLKQDSKELEILSKPFQTLSLDLTCPWVFQEKMLMNLELSLIKSKL